MSKRENTSPMTILILGAKGLLGQTLTKKYQDTEHTVIAVSRDDGDLTSLKVIEALCERHNPDAIFNAIAWTRVDDAEDCPEEAMHINRGVPAILNAILKGSSTHLTHFSTDFVFNGRSQKPYTIEDIPAPLSVYGKTKLAGEKALADLDPQNLTIIRTAWLFGHGKSNFVKTILHHAAMKSALSVVHDQFGSPTFADDLADAAMNLAAKSCHGLFHVVNTGIASWCELAAEAVRLTNIHCTINAIVSKDWPQKAVRPGYSVLDTTAYTDATGLTMRPWPQALCEFAYKDLENIDEDIEKINQKQ